MRRSLGLVVGVAVAAVLGAASARADGGPPVRATGATPFAPGCNGAPQSGTLFPGSEVEPFVAANPLAPGNLVAVYQQDRWSDGGAQADLTAYSLDGGRSWARPKPPPFSRCAGGTAANGGDYDRATDPWVSFGPDGTVHQAALGFNADESRSAVLVSSSRDGGRTWGPIATLQRDTTARLFNDKESITADPTDARYVYAVWDRVQAEEPTNPLSPFSGDTLFARSTDGGQTWEPTRAILDVPDNSGIQSIGNQIVVLGDGTLVNVFDLLYQGTPIVAVQRSTDKGRTWSDPIAVDVLLSSAVTAQGGVIDPSDGHPVRTSDLIPEAGADPRPGSRTLYVVWQDVRFSLLEPIATDQVVVASSTDGGLTWSDPGRVSARRDVQAFTPSVQVDRYGTVGVTYYDFTNDDPTGGPLNTDYWFTSSPNRGLAFAPRERVTPASFDMRAAPDANGFFLGDYVGLATGKPAFPSVFVEANAGQATNPTDLFSAELTPSSKPVTVAAAARARKAARPARRRLEGAIRLP